MVASEAYQCIELKICHDAIFFRNDVIANKEIICTFKILQPKNLGR